ncbi:HNH endonuclease family protein [Bifidobacterium xylocopae]|uniref:Deoxyribonuclease n=1 Tax=Bifidobacterium xylocopae TaxID=2493119 RepID=A0A366KBZ0_9BIFI|nr:deoxyribonuclease [Bifidobacterium xylocopae]
MGPDGPNRPRRRRKGYGAWGSAGQGPWSRPSHGSVRFRSSSLTERLLIALVLAVVVGITVGLVLPRLSPQVSRMTGGYTATGDAAQTLGSLPVVDRPRVHRHYNRDSFGFKQTDDDGDGCNIREDVLARDLKNVRYTTQGGCKVASGTLQDPYTGRTIPFTRGVRTSSAVQIDHVVALENAWRSGAADWDQARRYRLGNDPYNLLAVDGPSNQEKGSASADYWLPPRAEYHCDYVARQIGVKAKYGLSVTGREKDAMLAVLHSCPGQPVPSG